MQVKILAEGGNMKPGPALSQKLGPLGVPMNEVIQKINEATQDFRGMKVPVELDIDSGTKEFSVNVFSPPVSELIKKELGVEKGSGEQGRFYSGNASIEQIISIAKTKMPNLLCKDLKGAVKTVIGSCASLGILIESKPAIEVEEEVKQGKYDKEINEEKTTTDEEKSNQLKDYFAKLKTQQDKIIQQEKAQKEAKEAKKK